MLTKSQVLDAIKKSLVLYKREILDNEYSTKKYVDDAVANVSGGSGGETTAPADYGPYTIRYNPDNNRLEFIYTPTN